jgi:uncharacterized protein involved in exopolysaccharide biosynthesis
VLWAISRNKLIVLLICVVLALAGLAFGASRKPVYTATATIQVGQVNPNSPGFFGYVQSSASLATAFSRAITSEQVLAVVQKDLKLVPSTAAGRLSAAPIPQAPAFSVTATGSTQRSAVLLANVTANAVIAYESQSNSANPEAAALLSEYRSVSLQLRRENQEIASLLRKKNVSKGAISSAEATRDAEQAKDRAVDVAYTAAVSSQAPRSGLVSLLAGATSASSDKKSKVELYGLIGLLGGLVLGCAVAVLRERARGNAREQI